MTTKDNDYPEALQAIKRSVELLIKLKAQEIRGDRSLSEMIQLLDSAGFSSGEIIATLGASKGTVRPILSRARNKRKK